MPADDEIRVPLNMRVGVVRDDYLVWVECRRMVAGGRACGARWTADNVTSAVIIQHMEIEHP